MKLFKLLLGMLVVMGLNSCNQGSKQTETQTIDADTTEMIFPELAKNMTIYEVNIRQHTPEGTFQAFTKDLPRLKELGTEILWIMPVQPISEKNRKGSLGSYYSVSDYTGVNPEFGTVEDFKLLVEKAHELDLYVILDWVPNHTGWGHPWIEEHPEYYAKDSAGNVTYEADWTDIALLDHSDENLRKEMISAMEYWVKETNIDGFRCDHAGHEIPMLFWDEAIPHLNQIKNLFWLAEWDETKMHSQFDATYDWEMHHLTNEVAKGKQSPDILLEHVAKDYKKYGKEAYRLEFVTNHDENSWGGTVFERYGEAHKTYAVFMFTAYGIPMVYSGQEAGLDKRLKFFEKDTIDWTDPLGIKDFYHSLISLRKESPALWSAQYGGNLTVLEDDSESVIVYTRNEGDNSVTVALNFGSEPQVVNVTGLTDQSVKDYFSGEEMSLSGSLEMAPFGYRVFVY